MSVPLLPCPFCGANAKVCFDGESWLYVRCLQCDVRTPSKWRIVFARAAWNERVDAAQDARLLSLVRSEPGPVELMTAIAKEQAR